LPPNPSLPAEIKLAQARKLELTIEPPKPGAKGARWTINGEARSYAGKPILSLPRGAPLSLGFNNKSGVAIPMHVHGHALRLLHDLDDGWEPYWRNAVIVPAGRSKHVAFVADAPGKWALRSDIVEQEAAGLATWFEVT
jgi:FtsP/CotA-like multicopper oxidase with cupredoxin domain